MFLVLSQPVPDLSLATDSAAMLTVLNRPRLPALIPSSITVEGNGYVRLACDLWPGQAIEVETSTDLLNWTYLGWVYRGINEPPPCFQDTEAWKYPRRFYRIPLSQLVN